MQIVTPEQASTSMSELLQQLHDEPILIREGERNLGFLISPEDYHRDQLTRVETFEASRDAMVRALAQNLALEGLSVDQFVRELLT